MEIVLRANAMFFIVFLLLRLLGKHELGQMAPFEMVSLVVMGDLIQQGITHSDFNLTGATWRPAPSPSGRCRSAGSSICSPGLSAAWRRAQRIIIRDDALMEQNLRRDGMTRSEVESEMRPAGIGSMHDIAWAILEPQGKISFIKKERDAKPAQREDDGAPASTPSSVCRSRAGPLHRRPWPRHIRSTRSTAMG